MKNDVEKVVKIINAILKDVPSPLLRGKKEDFYHALVHLHFRYLGLLMDSEVNTSDGRMDAVVKTPSHIYIIEFKLNQSAEKALQQIKDKDYAAKYTTENKPIVLVGINFNSRKKAIGAWKMEDCHWCESPKNHTPKIIFLNKKSQKSKVKNLIKCLLIAFVLL